MKKINRVKLALDVLMLIVLLLMYNKNVLGMGFHEIGGMAVCGLFFIHKLLNGQWILAVTGRLFSKKTAWRCKLNWLVDFLLLLTFAYILVSGIFISKVVFDGQRGSTLVKTGHYAASALALALLGIHLGLHYESIIGRTPARRLPPLFRRITAIVMSVIILGFGVYEMTATSFLRWMGDLGAIISISQDLPEGDLPEFADGQEAETPPAGEADEAAETDAAFETGGHGSGARDGEGRGLGSGSGAAANEAAEPSLLPEVLLGFLSITLSFSVIIAWIGGSKRAWKRKQRLQCALPKK